MEPSLITIPLREYQQLVASVQEISKLRSELDYLQEKFAIDVAEDRQRITALEYQEPEPRNLDRGQVLKSLIITNSGKIARKEARKLMRLSEANSLSSSPLQRTLSKSHIKDRPPNKDPIIK